MGFVELVEIGAQEFLAKKRPVQEHGSINLLAAILRSFTNFEHLGTWNRASALCRRSSVLHCDLLWVLHLTLGLTLHAVGFHSGSPFLEIRVIPANCAHRASLRLIVDRCSTLLQLFELVASADRQLTDRLLLPPFAQVPAYDVFVTVTGKNNTNIVINIVTV